MAAIRCLHVDHHLADREEPHDHADEIDPGLSGLKCRKSAGRPRSGVLADQGGHEPDGHGDHPLEQGPAGEADDQAQPHEHQGKILRRTEDHRKVASIGAKKVRAMTPIVPATNEEMAEMARAGPGFPCLAIS